MLYLSCYDIENDAVRSKVAEKLLASGLDRVQYSVFIGPLTETARLRLLKAVSKLLDEQARAHFLLLPVLAQSLSDYIYVGVSAPDWDYLTGKSKTLII